MMSESTTRDESRQHNPCPVCSGTAFKWGRLNAPRFGKTQFVERTQAASASTQRKAQVLARECVRCGNVLLFTRN
jgi:hypothetical protein